jgi:hypothetical protein
MPIHYSSRKWRNLSDSHGIAHYIYRLNTREITRDKIRRARSTNSGEHGVPVHVVDPRRHRARDSDSDELVVRFRGPTLN